MSTKKLQQNIVEDIIQRNNKFYIIQKDADESREVYLDRANYLIKLLGNSKDISYNEALKRSYIWRNIKYYGMSYPSALTKIL